MHRKLFNFMLLSDAKIHQEIQIEDNATGYGYEKIFSKCLDCLLSKIEIEDPYIRHNHQVKLLLNMQNLTIPSILSVFSSDCQSTAIL